MGVSTARQLDFKEKNHVEDHSARCGVGLDCSGRL
jgi:hypothetical protein